MIYIDFSLGWLCHALIGIFGFGLLGNLFDWLMGEIALVLQLSS